MHRLRLTEASDPPLTYAATAQSELSCSKSTIIHLQQIDHHPSASRHVMTLKHANHQRNHGHPHCKRPARSDSSAIM